MTQFLQKIFIEALYVLLVFAIVKMYLIAKRDEETKAASKTITPTKTCELTRKQRVKPRKMVSQIEQIEEHQSFVVEEPAAQIQEVEPVQEIEYITPSLLSLPQELKLKVILTVLRNADFEDIDSFFTALPEFSDLVLFLSDNADGSYTEQPIRAKGYRYFDIYYELKYPRGQYVPMPEAALTVVCLSKFSDQYLKLNRLPTSFHWNHTTRFTPVFIQTRGKCYFGKSAVHFKTKSINVPFLRERNVTTPANGHLELIEDSPLIVRNVDHLRITPNNHYSLNHNGAYHTVKLQASSWFLDADFTGIRQFQWQIPKCGVRCSPPVLYVNGSGSQIQNFNVEFQGGKVPEIFFSQGQGKLDMNFVHRRTFSLENQTWSPVEHRGSSCVHFPDVDPAQWALRVETYRKLHWTYAFGNFIYKGLPDTILHNTDLRNGQLLVWHRQTPDQKQLMIEECSGPVNAPSLVHLSITAYLSKEVNDLNPMPIFHAPHLRFMTLVALAGSTESWNIKRLVSSTNCSNECCKHGRHTSHLDTLGLIGATGEDGSHVIVPLSSLEPISKSVQRLAISNYTAVMKLSDEEVSEFSGIQFPKLRDLTIDVCDLPVEVDQDGRRHCVIDFEKDAFPALQSIVLSNDDTENVTSRVRAAEASINLRNVPASVIAISLATMLSKCPIFVNGVKLEFDGKCSGFLQPHVLHDWRRIHPDGTISDHFHYQRSRRIY